MHVLLYYVPSTQDYGTETFSNLQEALAFEEDIITNKGGTVTWQ